jgi:hypothetical protein
MLLTGACITERGLSGGAMMSQLKTLGNSNLPLLVSVCLF